MTDYTLIFITTMVIVIISHCVAGLTGHFLLRWIITKRHGQQSPIGTKNTLWMIFVAGWVAFGYAVHYLIFKRKKP